MSELEHIVKVLTVDSTFGEELKKLEKEGYELMPGILPVIVYNLVRKKHPGIGGVGTIHIDDTKVHILREGKLIPLAEA